jgi:diguanylate cyclase (GGDEF)-like protein
LNREIPTSPNVFRSVRNCVAFRMVRFIASAVATSVSLTPEACLIWLAYGILLAYLLFAPFGRWTVYLFAACLAQFCGGMLLGYRGIAGDAFNSRRNRASAVREFQHSLIEAIHAVSLDGILVVDEHENVVSCNQQFGEIFGFTLSERLPGSPGNNLTIPDAEFLYRAAATTTEPENFLRRVKELYAKPDQEDQCQIELKNGHTLERYTTALHNKGGHYLGRVWFFRDISQHKLNEQRLQEAYRAVETLAVTDALTGLANRRRFDQCLAAEWRRGVREGQPLSLLLLDVDLFKSYNDLLGHLHGDTCLKQIAEVIQSTATRSGDMAARFGGEEFAVILPQTRLDGAIDVAESIRETLHARKLSHPGNPSGYITLSAGCATVTPQLGADPSSLIELADQALYKAKGSGRDGVCAASPGVRHKTIPIRPTAVNHSI